jgi:hypothetical protein
VPPPRPLARANYARHVRRSIKERLLARLLSLLLSLLLLLPDTLRPVFAVCVGRRPRNPDGRRDSISVETRSTLLSELLRAGLQPDTVLARQFRATCNLLGKASAKKDESCLWDLVSSAMFTFSNAPFIFNDSVIQDINAR